METNENTDAGQNQTKNHRPKETDIIKEALETGEPPEIERDDSTSETPSALQEKSEDSATRNI